MRPRTIVIKPVLNGFLVNVGCQEVVFESREKLLVELARYLGSPESVEGEYQKNALNRMDNVQPEQTRAMACEPTCAPRPPTGLRESRQDCG